MIDPLNRIAALWWTWMSGMFWQVGLLIVIVACLDAGCAAGPGPKFAMRSG